MVEAERIERIGFNNSRKVQVELWVEPWGDMVIIPPEEQVEVVFSGPLGDCVTVDFREDSIVVWGWSGSVFSVYQGNVKIGGCNCRVP